MGSRNFAMAGISFPQEVGRDTSFSLSFARWTSSNPRSISSCLGGIKHVASSLHLQACDKNKS